MSSWRIKMIKASDMMGLSAAHYLAGIKDKKLAATDAFLRSIPVQVGFAPSSWRHITDCSIPKNNNVLDALKMCTIVLFQADANMNNKYFMTLLMQACESAQLLDKSQGGS
jgi:hypothetical protein